MIINKTIKRIGFNRAAITYDKHAVLQKQISKDLYRPIDIEYQHGDSSNLIEKTKWSTTYTIEKTLEDLFNYWMQKIK